MTLAVHSQLLILFGVILLNGVFSGAEIAIISMRASRLRELADEEHVGARALLVLRKNPEQFLATVQIAITVISAAAAAFGGSVIAKPVAALLRRLGAGDWADAVAFMLVVSLVSFLSIVFGELVPKSLALRASERYALAVGPSLLSLSRMLRPLSWFLTAISNLVLRPLGDHTNFSESRMSTEELQQVVEEATSKGALHARAGEIASRAIDFGELRANALMVPRSQITWIQDDAQPAQLREILSTHAHSRYPVHGQDEQDVLGYVLARDVYEQLLDRRFDLKSALRKLPFIPERMPAVEVLRKLQASRSKIALVVDDYGAIAGLLSTSDLGEELVGEMLTEYDRPDDYIRESGDDSYVVLGTTPVHELNRELDLDLPISPDWSTIAGLVIAQASEIPSTGTRIALEPDVEVEVLDATNRGVRLLRLHRTQRPAAL